MSKNKALLFLLFLIAFATYTSCKKDSSDNIPVRPVDFYIDPNSTLYLELNIPGGWVYLTGGTRGIIVYRISQDEFRAYDRACPNEPTNYAALVKVETSNTTAIDSLCGSRFILLDGSVLRGPATLPLHSYHALYDGQTLHVYN